MTEPVPEPTPPPFERTEIDEFLQHLSPLVSHWQTQQQQAIVMHEAASVQLSLLQQAGNALRRAWDVQENHRGLIAEGRALLEGLRAKVDEAASVLGSSRDVLTDLLAAYDAAEEEKVRLGALRAAVAGLHPASGTCPECRVVAPCQTRRQASGAYSVAPDLPNVSAAHAKVQPVLSRIAALLGS